jgi:hypothetical protein
MKRAINDQQYDTRRKYSAATSIRGAKRLAETSHHKEPAVPRKEGRKEHDEGR